MLPGDALLEIFDWYLEDNDFYNMESWQTLVHVCRKWRSVVFGSPRRLNLRLFCTGKKPVRKILDFWPPFPIVVSGYYRKVSGEDNIVAALERNDRVCRIHLQEVSSSLLEAVLEATQEPFPALTDIELHTSARNHRRFPIPSWVDQPQICDISACLAFHIRDYRSYSAGQPKSTNLLA